MAGQGKHSILLVDDEPEVLYSLRGLLRRDYDVQTAESGAEALQLLQRQSFDVVMTDQRMPEMTGVQLLSQVQGTCPQAVRIVFTGYADIKAVIDAINQGRIYRYLTKPWDPDELQAVLHQACAEHDRFVERARLLSELRDYVQQGLTLGKALQEEKHGTLNPDGRAAIEQFTQAGSKLLERLERALA
jgi:response regulator RpfG family c-di-GMP phosphodiesterase